MRTEPLMGTTTIQSLIGAGIALMVGFGLDWSGEQVALITGFFAVLVPFVTAALTRQIVWSPASVEAIVKEAASTGRIPANTPTG